MANADGHLLFDTKVDSSGFNKGTSQLGSIAKKGLSASKVAIAGITTALGAGITAGVKYNSQMEDYMANFSVLLGSQEKATKKVAELKKMASATPFGMSDLAESTKTLLAFQVPADKTTKILQQLGDISLGNKEKLKGLSLVFGQVSSAGKLTGQDLMQFNFYRLSM